jgi:hypothetical protein
MLAFESRMLKSLFALRKYEVAVDLRKLRNKDLNIFVPIAKFYLVYQIKDNRRGRAFG